MTVRRRLLGSAVAFLAALALVTSAQAQDRRDPTTDDVKLRLLEWANRNRGGLPQKGMLPGFPPQGANQFEPQVGPGGQPPDGPVEPNPGGNKTKGDPAGKNSKVGPQPGNPRPGNPRPGDPFPQDPNGTGKVGPPTGVPGKEGLPPLPREKGTPQKGPEPGGPPPGRPKLPEPNRLEPPPPPPGRNDGRLNPGPEAKNPDAPVLPWEKPESPQDKARQAAAAMWEKSVGPLDETPAVKKALFDIVDGGGELKDPDGNGLWDSLTKDLGDGKSFGDLFKDLDAGGDWNLGGGADWSLPNFNWSFNWGNNRPPDIGPAGPPRDDWFSRWRRSPSTSSSSSSSSSSWFSGWKAPKWNIGLPSLDGTWWPLLFLIAALVGGVFLWRWLSRRGDDPTRIDPYALGPWPVDPHHLRTRADVVVAFEHLSVLLCGEVAKTWTHTTIAGALAEVAMAEPRRAMMLARLYELARYTPVDEPLTTAELAEARRLVCLLAGFSDD